MRAMTKQRQELIEGLQRNGGKLVANGKGLLSPEEVKETLGLSSENPKALAGFLQRAEKDGIIRRKMNGRRTLGIYLLHGKKQISHDMSTPKRPRLPKLQLPDVGSTVTISMVAQSRDGSFQIGVRDDTGAWVAEVQSFAAFVPEPG